MNKTTLIFGGLFFIAIVTVVILIATGVIDLSSLFGSSSTTKTPGSSTTKTPGTTTKTPGSSTTPGTTTKTPGTTTKTPGTTTPKPTTPKPSKTYPCLCTIGFLSAGNPDSNCTSPFQQKCKSCRDNEKMKLESGRCCIIRGKDPYPYRADGCCSGSSAPGDPSGIDPSQVCN